MAVVKGLSLEAIRSLKGSITFSTWKNLIVAKKHMRKIGPKRSPAVTIMNNRYKVACYYLKVLSAEVIDLFKEYTNGTDWTWKDAFISAFLRAWAENNAPPIVTTELAFSWGSPIAQLDFTFADWYYGFDFGYGVDGYGTCPYGTPTILTENQPHEIIPKYLFRYYEPRGKPYETFYGSPKNPGCKKPPGAKPTGDDEPTEKYTPDPTTVPITPKEGKKRWSGFVYAPNCSGAWNVAYGKWRTDPIYPAIIGSANVISSGVVPSGAQMQASVTSQVWTYEISYPDYISPANWSEIDKIMLPIVWAKTDDLYPWRLRVDVGSFSAALTPGDTPIEIPKPASYDATQLLTVSYDLGVPPEPCDPTRQMDDSFKELKEVVVHWKERLVSNNNKGANPPGSNFGINLAANASDLPIIGPIIDLLFPS